MWNSAAHIKKEYLLMVYFFHQYKKNWRNASTKQRIDSKSSFTTTYTAVLVFVHERVTWPIENKKVPENQHISNCKWQCFGMRLWVLLCDRSCFVFRRISWVNKETRVNQILENILLAFLDFMLVINCSLVNTIWEQITRVKVWDLLMRCFFSWCF